MKFNTQSMKWMAVGALGFVSILVVMAFLLRSVEGNYSTVGKLSVLRNKHRFMCEEIVARVQRELTAAGKIPATHLEIANARQVWRPLADAEQLGSNYIFVLETASRAIENSGHSVPVVLDQPGKYGKAGGGYVGFVNPEEVRWFPDEDFRKMLKQVNPKSQSLHP